MGEISNNSSSAGIDLSQFYQVFFEEAGAFRLLSKVANRSFNNSLRRTGVGMLAMTCCG